MSWRRSAHELARGEGRSGVQLASVDDRGATAIQEALHRHGVLVFPEQRLDREQQVEFTRLDSVPVHGHPVPEFLFGGADPVSVVENDGDKLPQDDQHFHVDYSFAPEIPDLAVLRAEVVPPTGGDTMWASAAAAYDALSPRMRRLPRRADGTARRRATGSGSRCAAPWAPESERAGARPLRGISHPIVCAHPVTGRRLLFVNPGYTVAINELSTSESAGRAPHALRAPATTRRSTSVTGGPSPTW